MKLKEYPKLVRIQVMLTRACQLDCVYCRYNKHAGPMSWNVLRRAIDVLVRAGDREVFLQFFGGEPMLRFDMIMKGMSYATAEGKKLGKKVNFTIATNGLLLNGERLAELSRYPVDYLFSMDGPSSVQNRQRPLNSGPVPNPHRNHGSNAGLDRVYPVEILAQNIKDMVARKENFFVNMVFSPGRAKEIHETFFYFLGLGVRKMRFSYREGAYWSGKSAAEYFGALKACFEEAESRGIKWMAFNSLCMDEPNIISPTPTVDCDGKVYLGGVIPALERDFPRIVEATRQGRIEEFKSLQELKVNRENLLKRLLTLYPENSAKGKIIANNVKMGLLSDRFFDNMKRRGYFSLRGT